MCGIYLKFSMSLMNCLDERAKLACKAGIRAQSIAKMRKWFSPKFCILPGAH